MLDGESAQVIPWLASQSGGWGSGVLRIDFSIEVVTASAATPFHDFVPNDDFYWGECAVQPVPLPPGGAIEGEAGYECTHPGADCHLLIHHPASGQLFEIYQANLDPATDELSGTCLVVWDLTRVYPADGRGNDCTSADAAGYPMTSLLFNADEVAAGHIDHAIRFILPNTRIRDNIYIHPSTHSTGPTAGPATAPPYGTRLRLRADYPLQNLPSEGARVVARAMQKHGILLSDGGTLALTAQADTFTQHKWDEPGIELSQYSLQALLVSDFAMIDGGTRYNYGDAGCALLDPLLGDGFEAATLLRWDNYQP